MNDLRAFLVEDSEIITSSLVEALHDLAKVQVIGSAKNEADATAWLAGNHARCDLVIVDVFLATGSGLGVLRAAKLIGASCTFVVLSNFATAEMRTRCLELGAAKVFDKSFEIEDLTSFCAALTSSSQ